MWVWPFSLELLAADYDAILAAYLGGKRFKHVDCIVAVAAVGGRSDNNRLTMLLQRIAILRRQGLMTLPIAWHYARLMTWVLFVAPLKRIVPQRVLAFILRHRAIKGLG